MQATLSLPAATLRERWAWYLYDFGNSAYAAVVLLAIYSAYFKEQVVGGAEGSRLWGLSLGVAMFVVAVTAPVLGTIADYSAFKKRFLLFYTVLACLFTGLLFFVQQGDILIGILFFILAEIGYRSAQVFYNALLPEIATPAEMGRVSGNGWAIGSAGGILCLLIVLPLIVLIGGTFIVRLSLAITALFFAVSAIPIFTWLRERGQSHELPAGETYLSLSLKRLWKTFQAARNYKEFLKFMAAFVIYNDGIIMALDFAAIIGTVLYGMTQQELIIFIILVQVTSVAGAYLFGLLTDYWSSKQSLVISLLLMIAAVGWLYVNPSKTGFFLIGGLAGFALTGVQSVSRTMVGLLSPPGQSAEFYGLFAVVGRGSSLIGPVVYGLIAAEAALWYTGQGFSTLVAEQMGQRLAIVSIAVFLVAGLVILLFVNEKEGRAAVRESGLQL
ncbi:MAG: MFS transporter [Anaerolineae bacterium]|nr:MFS transporter [Anaerolineae bacterium]